MLYATLPPSLRCPLHVDDSQTGKLSRSTSKMSPTAGLITFWKMESSARRWLGVILLAPHSHEFVITSPSKQRIRHHNPLKGMNSSSQAPHSHEFVITSPSQPRIRHHKLLAATTSSSQAPHSLEFLITNPSQPPIPHHKPLTAMKSSSEAPNGHRFVIPSPSQP